MTIMPTLLSACLIACASRRAEAFNSIVSLTNNENTLNFNASNGCLLSAGIAGISPGNEVSGPVFSGRRQGEYFLSINGTEWWLLPDTISKSGKNVVLECHNQNAKLNIAWEPVLDNAFLVTITLTASSGIDDVMVGMECFNIEPAKSIGTYCLPHSYPLIRKNSKPIDGLIPDSETWNNTFSIMTTEATYSLSYIPTTGRTSRIEAPADESYFAGLSTAKSASDDLTITYCGMDVDMVGTLSTDKDGKPDHKIRLSGIEPDKSIKEIHIYSGNLNWTSDSSHPQWWKCVIEKDSGGICVYFADLSASDANAQTTNNELPDPINLKITFSDKTSMQTTFSASNRTKKLSTGICDGSIFLAANLQSVRAGEEKSARFLVSISPNKGGYTAGRHLGQYMNLAPNMKSNDAISLYRKLVSYLLDNPGAYTNHGKIGDNYWGAVHSQNGSPYGNGTALYAMYGNSFTIAALNQYAMASEIPATSIERLSGPRDFLLKSDVQNPDGSYWSMYAFKDGFVDQAYRKWIETHATGWITYFLLIAYEVSGDESYLEPARKAVKRLTELQRPDGSFPKYIADGKPSSEPQGDSAWNALALFKAHSLNLKSGNRNLRDSALKCTDWIIKNQLPSHSFYGSFEDVGGVLDSYCPSVSALAMTEAFRQTGNTQYLTNAKQSLYTALSWVTCGNGRQDYSQSWNKEIKLRPAWGHIESTTCYYPCSYTLPLLYMAASEVARLGDGTDSCYWTGISKQMSLLDAFILETGKTKTPYGMEWRVFPFLVFSEWGNSQTCWTIMETLKNRIAKLFPEVRFTPDMKADLKGKKYTIYAPKWDGQGPLCSTGNNYDLLVMKEADTFIVILLAEGESVKTNIRFPGLVSRTKGDKFIVKSLTGSGTDGTYSRVQLTENIFISCTNGCILEIKPIAE